MGSVILLSVLAIGQYTGPPPTMMVPRGDGTAIFMNCDKDGNPVSFAMNYGHPESWYTGGAPPNFPNFTPAAKAASKAKPVDPKQAQRRAASLASRAYRAKYPRN